MELITDNFTVINWASNPVSKGKYHHIDTTF